MIAIDPWNLEKCLGATLVGHSFLLRYFDTSGEQPRYRNSFVTFYSFVIFHDSCDKLFAVQICRGQIRES